MPRIHILLLAVFAAAAHGRRLDFSFGYPFYSPVESAEDSEFDWDESRKIFSAGVLWEPAPFLAVGPRLGWSSWGFRDSHADEDFFEIRKWDIGWSVVPHKEIFRNIRLFLDASIGLQYLDYVVRLPDIDAEGRLRWKEARSKTEWGYGRSLGLGLEVFWLQVSVHHDAFVAETLPEEFAGVRAAIGIVYRKRR